MYLITFIITCGVFIVILVFGYFINKQIIEKRIKEQNKILLSIDKRIFNLHPDLQPKREIIDPNEYYSLLDELNKRC